jgi:flagellar motor switch protein FliN/FliY
MAGGPQQFRHHENERPVEESKTSSAPESIILRHDEAESLVRGGGLAARASSKPHWQHAAGSSRALGAGSMPSGDIDLLLEQAEQALASVQSTSSEPAEVASFNLVDFGEAPASTHNGDDLPSDAELDLKIELGRAHMHLEEVLRLSRGAVVPLDRLAGDLVDIHVNGRLVARGDVMILGDRFCVRVAELVEGEAAVAGRNPDTARMDAHAGW